MRGACPAVRCCPLAGARPALRLGLLHHSPALPCHRLSAAAAPWAASLPSVADGTARKALGVGVAVRSAPDPGPSSRHGHGGPSRPGPYSHAGGRGRQGGRGIEGLQGWDGWQGRGPGRGGGGRQSGARAPAPSGRGRGRGSSTDPSRPSHLEQLQEYVRQGAGQWADETDYKEFFLVFNEAGKVTLMLPSACQAAQRQTLVAV